jgi:hypothetical protein
MLANDICQKNIEENKDVILIEALWGRRPGSRPPVGFEKNGAGALSSLSI